VRGVDRQHDGRARTHRASPSPAHASPSRPPPRRSARTHPARRRVTRGTTCPGAGRFRPVPCRC